ncbi:TRAP transporter large permease subunit [Natrarchaeobius chitinivorans]|uniref:TRAP transporter large permease subunit n=1 Tax=Natrarchaeobius chitinivorans TaxID=1679083 RepID=A0A3N6N2E7_NATCH|nr:TRAP transporter large permease subunit [Natrarchaeobius chitinivorans]RQG92192.1 TRAP transporter large permease subunit [Natrarchaeobius chitinivorans]
MPSGGVLIIAAILGMIVCILLGLGMPTTAAYTIVALLVAPVYVNEFFLPELASHFFVFYAAILAGLTPPIATCVAVASGIAKSGFWKTCAEAIKIAGPLWIIPFSFLYHPYFVDGNFSSATLILAGIILVGSVSVIYGLNYPFTYRTHTNLLFRTFFVVFGAITIVHPSTYIQALGIGAVIVLTALHRSSTFIKPKAISKEGV